CSLYVLRADETLELSATEGLSRGAVHQASLQVGQGLVGTVARDAAPVNAPDAQNHPDFAYLPGTGEEAYRSFLGVPVLRAGRTLGVLTVQNRTNRLYTEDEAEALQTVAMVLAEMIAAGALEAIVRGETGPELTRPYHCHGSPLADGIGLGRVVLHAPRVAVGRLIAEDADAELERLEAALRSVREDVDGMLARGDLARSGEHRDVLEAFRMFAHDRGWAERMREAVASGLSAEAAVERVQSDTRARLTRQPNAYLRERLNDLDDLANRLLRALTGDAGPRDMPQNAILVARTMGPAELLDYDRERLRGIVLEEGARNSHVVIVAKALGLPLVGSAESVVGLANDGDSIIVDGTSGDVHLRPPEDVQTAYAEKVRFRAKRQAQYRALRDLETVTRDGRPISLMMNASLLVDLPQLDEANADGIGLFRTEFQFMVADRLPRTGEQEALYSAVLEAARGRPVTFRSLDVGGDKVLPYLKANEEENPAMGWRAMRLALDRPGLMRSQLRALVRASSERELRLMFPMVANMTEFRAARAMLEHEIAFVRARGRPGPRSLKLGAMLELPSILFELDRLLAEADFASVGSNDLMQFLFAADRENARVADRFDPLSVPALRALRSIVETGRRAGKPIALCGELGGRPLEAMALIGLGFSTLSISPSAFGPVKAMILALDADAVSAEVANYLDAPDAESLRPRLERFARAHGVPC
ncbi:MAG: phosphoenolpyruvate--protein phosphotransferase, partial [Pseudomonadota bacterium]